MRWLLILLCCLLAFHSRAESMEGRIYKVLPQFLDTNGLASISPSLYDRDAYQAILRRTPAKRSALRFAVQWKARTPETEPLKLRVEMRGIPSAVSTEATNNATIEISVQQHHWFSHWAYLALKEDEYKKLVEVTAWHVTLWDGDRLLCEQKSFLW